MGFFPLQLLRMFETLGFGRLAQAVSVEDFARVPEQIEVTSGWRND